MTQEKYKLEDIADIVAASNEDNDGVLTLELQVITKDERIHNFEYRLEGALKRYPILSQINCQEDLVP